MMTPYLRWKEKNESLYEMIYDKHSYANMRWFIFPRLNKPMARMMGLPVRAIKVRKIDGILSIYVSKSDWDKRRQDITTCNTHRDYANCLYGLLSVVR